MSIKVFISYAHKDEEYKNDLIEHLGLLKRNSIISVWHDRNIDAGDDWRNKIDSNLESSNIVIMLISSSFISSDYCYDIEMKKAIEMHNSKKCIVVPIIVRSCDWQESVLGEIQALPENATPINTSIDKDSVWTGVIKQLKKVIEDFKINNNKVENNKSTLSLEKSECFNSKFYSWLEDTEILLTHKIVYKVSLSNIYVYPDLRKIDYENDNKKILMDLVVSSKIRLSKDGYYLVLGEDQQGKTALLKMIYIDLLNNGKKPLYINAKNIEKSDVYKNIEKALCEQYIELSSDDCNVLIIDDFHKIKLNKKHQRILIDGINDKFDHVIITSHDSVMYNKEDRQFFDKYEVFDIWGLGHSKREEMILKWVSLGVEEHISEVEMYQQCDNLKAYLNTIIKQNIVPPKPIYILLLLQMFEAYSAHNLELTSYGHCYQQLIYSAFDRAKIKKTDFEKYLNVLTELSWAMYKNNHEIEEDGLNDFFISYKKNYIIDNNREIINTMIDHSILANKDEIITFKYPYIYYFFIGKKIAESYADYPEVQNEVNNLLKTLHIENSANILIFIAHHTKNKWVLTKILDVMDDLFSEQEIATLAKDQLSFMSDFINSIPKLVLKAKDISKERARNNDDLDKKEITQKENNNSDNYYVENELIYKINKTFKGMEISGQIIRNRHASMKIDDLLSLANKSASASLRLLNYFIEISETSKNDIIEIIENHIDKNPEASNYELQKNARHIYSYLTYGVINGVIKKISASIGSKDALSIYENIANTNKTPAFLLINVAIEIQQTRSINTKTIDHAYDSFVNNPVCLRILQQLILEHIYMFPVDYKIRQHIASKLNISVEEQQKIVLLSKLNA